MLLLACLLLFPVPAEPPPTLTQWGRERSWTYPDKWQRARHAGKITGLTPVPDLPGEDWPPSPRTRWGWRVSMTTVWVKVPGPEGVEMSWYFAVCDDPDCPGCSPLVYQNRK